MKVCPQCGYREPSIWLNHQFQQHVQYCRIEDFEAHYPELAKDLEKGGDLVSDTHYFYRLTISSPFVYRWEKEYGEKGYHLDYEKHKSIDPFQKQLLEPKQ